MLHETQKAGQTALKTGVTTEPPNTKIDTTIKTYTVNVFFDGTRNNLYNSETKRLGKAGKLTDNVSHDNYYSNIALMYLAMDMSRPNIYKIYVEGSGSGSDQEDDMEGLGMALGWTGRARRITYTIEALEKIRKTLGNPPYSSIVLNVFGFSRGAAWARHFCYKIKNDAEKKHATINFVGILDTVSSDDFKHYNDVAEMGLDIGKPQQINRIIHLTAQNDYREHFPLTPLKTACKEKIGDRFIGFECSLPGAHSDIGGGYSEVYPEYKEIRPLAPGKGYIDYQWFIRKGYYAEGQYKTDFVTQTIWGKRKVRFLYQFICFEILRDIAYEKSQYSPVSNYATISREAMQKLQKYIDEMKKHQVLGKFYKKCNDYIMQNYEKGGGGYTVPLLDNNSMKAIYNNFIHNSLEYSGIANVSGAKILTEKSLNIGGENIVSTEPMRPMVTEGFRT